MPQGQFKKSFKKVFWALSSLKLAVLVIFSLAVGLAAGTIVESRFDTATAQYYIYRAFWFRAILFMLGVNILCVALSRYPWKKKHIPFLVAHLGILILLGGSWVTDRFGIDGNMRISEGESSNIVDLDSASLVLSEVVGGKDEFHLIPIPWLPPSVQFSPFSVKSHGLPYDVLVDQYLTHADPIISFVPKSSAEKSPSAGALHLKIVGGPMGISQDLWLWEGQEGWRKQQAGPAVFELSDLKKVEFVAGQPHLALHLEKDAALSYVAHSSDGKKVQGKLSKNWQGQVLRPGWKGGVSITLLEWIPDAVPSTKYVPARIQYGSQAPSSAIHVKALGKVDVWLGLGDRAVLHFDDRDVDIGYYAKRIALPFSVLLDRFTVDHDQGTMTPAAYSSRVRVIDSSGQPSSQPSSQKDVTISMNEPLKMKNFTLYQASYEDGSPRPVTSIFAVNQDPGRFPKYFGSLLIVLGSIQLFWVKYRQSRKTSKARA